MCQLVREWRDYVNRNMSTNLPNYIVPSTELGYKDHPAVQTHKI